MKKIALFILITILTLGCSNDDDSQPVNKSVTFNFTHNWDGQSVSLSDYNTTEFTNEFGNALNISKLRYLISRLELKKPDGSKIAFEEYILVDLEDPTSLNLTPAIKVPVGDYSGISFIYGFNEQDNISGAYLDLNLANWGWPDMMGGGYHFLQMEGKYKDTNGDPQLYAYHNGMAMTNTGDFEQNFISFDFNGDFEISDDATIEIKMNIAEWYKNPYLWDLNVFNVDLMMNYEAQKHMNENGATVFSIGAITQ